MVRELKSLDVTDAPELLRLAEEVRRTGEPRVLRRGAEDLAVLVPAAPAQRRPPRGRALTRDDALFRLVGIGRSEVPGGVSGKKREYLLQAYREHHQ